MKIWMVRHPKLSTYVRANTPNEAVEKCPWAFQIQPGGWITTLLLPNAEKLTEKMKKNLQDDEYLGLKPINEPSKKGGCHGHRK